MKKDNIEYNLLVFLYTYLRQADLSLDRSRWGAISDLRTYYNSQINPKVVSDYLLRDIDCKNFTVLDPKESWKFSSRIINLFLVFFRRKSLFTSKEACYCGNKLLQLHDYLNSDIEMDKLKIEKLRVEIAIFNYEILGVRLLSSDRNKAEKIEHFMSNDHIRTIKMSEIVNSDVFKIFG